MDVYIPLQARKEANEALHAAAREYSGWTAAPHTDAYEQLRTDASEVSIVASTYIEHGDRKLFLQNWPEAALDYYRKAAAIAGLMQDLAVLREYIIGRREKDVA